MFNINAQPSTLNNFDDTLDKLETVIETTSGSLHLIETNSVDNITAGLDRNVYFPSNTSKSINFLVFNLYLDYIKYYFQIFSC